MSAVDPQQEVSDLKRKLRLIKNKLLTPTERNLRQAINMIDDTFATDEVHMNCSRFGIRSSPAPMFAVPGYPINYLGSPMAVQQIKSEPPPAAPTMANAYAQTDDPDLCTRSTQTIDTGEICSFSKSALYNATQTNIQKAIEILTETKCSLSDRGKKRKHDGGSYRSKAPSPISTALCSPAQYSKSLVTPTGRPSVNYLQRVQKQSESSKPTTSNMLMSSEKLAIGDGISGKYTPTREKNFDLVSAEKKKRIKDIGFTCKYCCFNGDSEMTLFYHDCIVLPQTESPFICCGTSYKHRGYYTRHRDMKHKKQTRSFQ